MASRIRRCLPVLCVLGGGLLLRLVLAYVVFPGQGLRTDLGLFESWAQTLTTTGPGAFYATAASANYPPGYLYVLWLIGMLGAPVGALLGISSGEAIVLLLKLPAIAADVAVASLLYRAARRWFGGHAGLVAAALYLFIPVTWYDSALWGQVDAVVALVMTVAVLLLVDGWEEPAAALAVFGVLVKPQAAIALVVVLPVLIRRHLLRPGSGPVPCLGPRLAALDRRLGGLLRDQGPGRFASSAIAAAAAAILPLIPFDITRSAPSALADVPVIGHLAGLVGLFISVGDEYSVLTANAFNVWALAGPDPLARMIGANDGSWTPDSIAVLGGLPASTVGAALLCLVGLLVSGGLLVRDGRLPIWLGFAVVAFAFYALPTRVHERYLFPFFAAGALLASGCVPRVVGYVLAGLANAVNIHAVLASPLELGRRFGSGGSHGGLGGSSGGQGGLGGGPSSGGFGAGGEAKSILLPFADLARSEAVVILVAVAQTVALLVLVAAWLILVVRPKQSAVERQEHYASERPSAADA